VAVASASLGYIPPICWQLQRHGAGRQD